MPKITNETTTLLQDFTARLERLVEAAKAEGRDAALADLRRLMGDAAPSPVRRGPGRPKGRKAAPKSDVAPAKKRKSSWAGLTAEARLARVNAIRTGKGLPPKESL